MITFNAIIGNPPYQISDGGGTGDSAKPVYHEFVRLGQALLPSEEEIAKEAKKNKQNPVPPYVLTLIIQSRWLVGGRSELHSFLDEMNRNEHLIKLCDFENYHLFFPTAHIDGGICYFLHNQSASNNGIVNYYHQTMSGAESTSKRKLIETTDNPTVNVPTVVLRDASRQMVIDRINKTEHSSLSSIISKRRPFGIRSDIFNRPENYPGANHSDTEFEGSALIYAVKGKKGGAKRKQGYISRAIVTKNADWIDKYKILFSKAYSANAPLAPEDILSYPGSLAAETFLVIGPFDTEEEMQRCHRYLHTDFARALLCFGHATMNVTDKTFQFVPLPDFSDRSAVPWGASDEELDRWFYNQFGLTRAEQAVIRRTVHPALRAGNQA